MPSLTVIVPFYNEEIFLSESLHRLINTNLADKILLIDDCSNDKSVEIAKKFENNYKNISLIQSSVNSGKGGAMSLSVNNLDTDFVVVHDADLEYNPTDLIEMFNLAVDNPEYLILGTRFVGRKKRKNIYKRTYFANQFLSMFFSIIHGKKITDVATCYKMMSSNNFKKIEITENGFAVEIEILSKFLKTTKDLIEYPIDYTGRSYQEGKKIKLMDGFKYVYSIVKYRF
tara:strand:+ start:2328 stop:3014 length:687 start_codon:yes stop_codon:yes gene_type:complete